jgi:hypothetical protein
MVTEVMVVVVKVALLKLIGIRLLKKPNPEIKYYDKIR